MLALARGGADLVLGSRYVPGGGIVGWYRARRAVSRGGCAYARAVLRVPVRDLTGGMKVWRADALRAIEPATVRSQGYAFQVELTYRALRRGLRVTETPIVFRERSGGASKMTPADRARGGVGRARAALILAAATLPKLKRHEHREHGPGPGMGRHPLDAAPLERAPRPRARAVVARLARDRARCCSSSPG